MKKILTIVMLCLIPLGALLLLLAQNVPGFAEGYAAAVYPVWSRGVNFVTSLLPFSLAEFLVYLAVPAALFFLIRFAARMIGGKGRRGKLLKRFSVKCGLPAGGIAFLFYRELRHQLPQGYLCSGQRTAGRALVRGRTDQPVPNPAGGCEQRAPAGAGG